jgi:phosphatidylserine/phosphatidylglycerophosphate/cardiolipin synthase-like enzyme
MNRVRLAVAGALAVFVFAFTSIVASAAPASSLAQVWVEPSAGYGFLYSTVLSAHTSIDMSMYELKDPTMVSDLSTMAARGVNVTVIVNSAYFGSTENAAAANALRTAGVHVVWAPSGQIFHAKYLVIDARRAYIGSGNLVVSDYGDTRDFWVLDTTAPDVRAIQATFSNDVNSQGTSVSSGGLVWSPDSTASIDGLIASAHRSLLIENEEMYSYDVEDALVAAAQRGVNVTVVMTRNAKYSSDLAYLARNGVHVRLLSSGQLYIHAKVICVDCTPSSGVALVSRINFSTSSLSYNRELGVITATPAVVSAVRTAVLADASIGAAFH